MNLNPLRYRVVRFALALLLMLGILACSTGYHFEPSPGKDPAGGPIPVLVPDVTPIP